MGHLTLCLNLTLDGCIDHEEGIADEETHAHFTQIMDAHGAVLWGRLTYELMEAHWPAVARGDIAASAAELEWAQKLNRKPKYVVSATRQDFSWSQTHLIADEVRERVQALKDATPQGVLLGSAQLANALDRLGLIDEYQFLIQPRIAGRGPTLYGRGLPSTRALELVSLKPMRCGAVAVHYRRA